MPEKIIPLIQCSHCKREFPGTASQRGKVRTGKRAYHSPECRRAARPTLQERFSAHVKRLPNGCLECSLATHNSYPMMKVGGRMRQISHIAWFLHYGEWPAPGIKLDHTCHIPESCDGGVHDPHRLCAEWSHLKQSTHAENTSNERSNGGRVAAARQRAKTHCPQGHEYTEANTYVWGDGCRKCRICMRDGSRKYMREKRAGQRLASTTAAVLITSPPV